jgi:putative FmdB family regulatory protein
MPIYEFICDHCRKNFELLATRSEDQVAPVCPHCQSPEITRMLSRVNARVSSPSSSASSLPQVHSRSCGSGNCSTIEIPGPTK